MVTAYMYSEPFKIQINWWLVIGHNWDIYLFYWILVNLVTVVTKGNAQAATNAAKATVVAITGNNEGNRRTVTGGVQASMAEVMRAWT